MAPMANSAGKMAGNAARARRRGLTLDLAVASAAYLYFLLMAHFPWLLASLSGAAIGALMFSARRTLRQLAALRGPRFGLEREDQAPDADSP
jgi:hypothetical protein